jgi:hypothetical protein
MKEATLAQVLLRCDRFVQLTVLILRIDTISQKLPPTLLLILVDCPLNTLTEQLDNVGFALDPLHHQFVLVAFVSNNTLPASQGGDIAVKVSANVSNSGNVVSQPALATFGIALVVRDQIVVVGCASDQVVDVWAPNLWQSLPLWLVVPLLIATLPLPSWHSGSSCVRMS